MILFRHGATEPPLNERQTMRYTLMMAAAMSVAAAFAGEVRPTAFRQLAPGVVKPDGWLRDVLRLQAEGITGHAEELYKDIGESDWLTGGRRGGEFEWERGPYYARGLQVLAWQLDDATLKERAQGWIEAILKSQRDDGDFGPKRENWWANMLALYMMRDNYLATGDIRCAEFVKKYARFQQTALKKKSLHGDSMWACARGGDGMEVFLDFYDLTGDAEFLEAAKLYMSQTAPWTEYYYTGSRNESYQEHIVNFNEGLKEPALVWRLTGDKRAAGAYAAAMDKGGWSQLYAGRPDRMQNGEEPLSGRNASGGTELCAQAERIISCADQVSVFANVKAADDMETVAYNCLPATIYPDFTGIRYYLPLNCPRADNNKLFYAHNPQVYSITPSPHSGFGCCRSNFHIAWPKFVQSMWMATADGGLAAVAYGPCTVRAKVGSKDVAMRMVTDYPFRGIPRQGDDRDARGRRKLPAAPAHSLVGGRGKGRRHVPQGRAQLAKGRQAHLRLHGEDNGGKRLELRLRLRPSRTSPLRVERPRKDKGGQDIRRRIRDARAPSRQGVERRARPARVRRSRVRNRSRRPRSADQGLSVLLRPRAGEAAHARMPNGRGEVGTFPLRGQRHVR